jgi:type 1 glutamine amidotransferase
MPKGIHFKVFLLLSVLLCVFCNSYQPPLKVALISGSNEYISAISLTDYKNHLENNQGMTAVLLQADGEINEKDEYSNLSGTEMLNTAEVLLVFTRRTSISGSQLEHIKSYVTSGKGGLVALRTASHGFLNWPEFDKDILGGNYHMHHPGSPEKRGIDANGARFPIGEPEGPIQEVKRVPGKNDHPVLQGIVDFTSKYSLYRTAPVDVLMTGTIPDQDPEPVVWTRERSGARVVYIALGGLQDWKNPIFVKLVTNALHWAAKRPLK